MVKRSRVYCSGSSTSGGNRRSVVVTVSALVLYILLCGGGAVLGTSFGDRAPYAAPVAGGDQAAGVRRFADDTTALGSAAAAAAAATATAARNGRSTANLSHITGTARKIKMFIKNGYLQVFPDGVVNSTAEDTSDYVILQRASVNMGQLKIQGVATCMYLCMDACGLLYGSKDFEDECVFNEMIEQHHYNTYSSAKYTNDRRTLYLALNKRGLPRKVQVKANAPLGKLSTYTRVLTQQVSAQRVEQLLATRPPVAGEWPASIPHGHRHHHACPPHVGPPLATSKHRKSGRKCQAAKGRKKSREDTAGHNGHGGGGGGGSREDEDCGGGGNKRGNKCGDEISHRKSDAAGRKKKSKKPTSVAAKGDKQQRHHEKARKAEQQDVQPLEHPAVVQDEDDDDDDDVTPAGTASPTDEFLGSNDSN